MIPGEIDRGSGDIELNVGSHDGDACRVANTGDRPIQVGSHYHFYETNTRARLRSRRGARLSPQHRRRHRGALRARPGARGASSSRTRARAKVYGFQGKVMGPLEVKP